MQRTVVPALARTAVLAVALAALLAGCSPQPADPETSPSTSASSAPSETPVEEPAVFVAPADCTGLLGADLEAEILGAGNVLFSGPGGIGIYPNASVGQDGGSPIACLYGKDMVDLSTFELAAQGLTQDAHEGVLTELQSRGMTETTDGDTVTFTQEGTEGGDPAIIHVLHPDSWITAYSTFGGAASLAKVTGWAETLETQVNP